MTSCPVSFTTYLDRHWGYSRKVSFADYNDDKIIKKLTKSITHLRQLIYPHLNKLNDFGTLSVQ